jgi:hypothetical protein
VAWIPAYRDLIAVYFGALKESVMNHPMRLSLRTLAAAATAALALTACDRAKNEAVGQAKDGSAGVAAASGTALPQSMDTSPPGTSATTPVMPGTSTDASITEAVHAALARDAELRPVRIDVETVDGKAALRGQVPDASARERAAQIAQGVSGVRSIDNQLVVGKA